jgi:uncharacterized protein with FMN-binding domain
MQEKLKKILPLAQLFPAVAIVALVAVSLPNSRPVLAAIPERLEANTTEDETVAEAEEEATALSTELLPYEDGVYTGSAQGYGGLITVQVTIESGRITDIQILDASSETASFFNRAKTLVETVLTKQTWEVDTVSGATYSSKGILGAIQNALTGEKVANEAPVTTTPTKLVTESFSAPAAYKDGVYTASAQGFGGLITVQVTITNGVISDVTILDASSETGSYFARAKAVVSSVVSSGSPNVDTVSGATYSSNGILNAIKRALNQAATDATATETVVEQTTNTVVVPDSTTDTTEEEQPIDPSIRPAKTYVDGVYEGTGEGFGGDVTVSVTVSDGRIDTIEVVSADDETPAYFAQAKAVLTSIRAKQTTDVDAVSGATFSSNGLKEAVENALSKAEATVDPTPTPDPEPTPEPTPDPVPTPDPTPTPELPSYVDGTYTAVAACEREDVFSYNIRVNVTITDGAIASIDVLREDDTSDEPDDNIPYLNNAINGRTYKNVWYEGVVKQIVDKQSADNVDVVSKATYSSKAIQTAAQDALNQAKRTDTTGTDDAEQNTMGEKAE